MVDKHIVVIPFLGGRLEVSNAYDYTKKDGTTGKARAGVFLVGLSVYPVDVTCVDLEQLGKQLKANKMAQAVIRENNAANEV